MADVDPKFRTRWFVTDAACAMVKSYMASAGER